MSFTRVISVTNFFVGIQPKKRISRFLPINPSEVQTIPNRRGYNSLYAIFKSMKLEWFIRIRQGPKSLGIEPVLLNLVAIKSGIDISRITELSKNEAFSALNDEAVAMP